MIISFFCNRGFSRVETNQKKILSTNKKCPDGLRALVVARAPQASSHFQVKIINLSFNVDPCLTERILHSHCRALDRSDIYITLIAYHFIWFAVQERNFQIMEHPVYCTNTIYQTFQWFAKFLCDFLWLRNLLWKFICSQGKRQPSENWPDLGTLLIIIC